MVWHIVECCATTQPLFFSRSAPDVSVAQSEELLAKLSTPLKMYMS